MFTGFACAACAPAQVITTVAGTTYSFANTVTALKAPLGFLNGVAIEASGNVYASDQDDSIVVRISPAGNLTAVAGNGVQGFSGDGGAATSASLSGPKGVAVDTAGNLYIADTGNARVRKVANGTITTVAGNGNNGLPVDGGAATSTPLLGPDGVAVDTAGNLYIADNSRIRKVAKIN